MKKEELERRIVQLEQEVDKLKIIIENSMTTYNSDKFRELVKDFIVEK